MSAGRAHHCPDCLSRDGVFCLMAPGQPCPRCERVAEIQLSPREIRMCLTGEELIDG